MAEQCIHYWICSNPQRIDGKRVAHERCQKCGGERDLIADITSKCFNETKYTEIKYPEKGGKMENTTKKIRSNVYKKHANYLTRKDEIIATYKELGRTSLAAKNLDMPSTTLRQLLITWGEYNPGKPARKVKKGSTSSSATVHSVDNHNKKVNSAARFRFVEANAEEITADIKSGMTNSKILAKWGISDNAVVNFKYRHGLAIYKNVASVKLQAELIAIFEGVLLQPDITSARVCWQGVKLAKGY